mmetsp:Transcript_7870/g.19841  ORF Transcript_7870/g.19841 Transcript_7870/m.19841 type:complete len:191 (-) Transcript_7870:866-1438(-)
MSKPRKASGGSTPNNTVLCLGVPFELASQVDVVRMTHDKSCHRWPPHISLFVPFPLRSFSPAQRSSLNELLRCRIAPFRLRFDRFMVLSAEGSSTKDGRCYVALNVIARSLIELHRELSALFEIPEAPSAFRPHLTVGQSPTIREAQALADRLNADWTTYDADSSSFELLLMFRPQGGGRCRPLDRFALA